MGIHHRFLTECAQGLRQWTPRERRYPVEITTKITAASGESCAAVISNLSNKGCRIATPLELRPSERLTLVVEPLVLVEAEVRWTQHDEAGVKFEARDAFHSDYRFSYDPEI